jgi:hypothetical protein
MKGTIHRLILESAVSMLPSDMKAYLSDQAALSNTPLEFLKYGAVEEDSTTEKGPLENPDRQNIPEFIFPGKYWPDMEHFWNTDLQDGIGLTIAPGGILLAQFRTALDRASEYYFDHVLPEYNNDNVEEAMKNLGRVIHLLTDVGTPCHIHGDPHINLGGLSLYDDDDYEDYTGYWANKYGSLPMGWGCTVNSGIVFDPAWDLSTYFHQLGAISRLYDSDDSDGLGNGHPYHWDHWYESAEGILPIERDVQGDLTDEACHAIARDLVPVTIRFAAGVLCYFFQCIGFDVALDRVVVSIKRFQVYDDTDPMGSGEIFLRANLSTNSVQAPSWTQLGGQWDLKSGSGVNFTGIEFPFAFTDRHQKVYFRASAYDDDSNYFSDDSESMGDITYVLDLMTLDPNNPIPDFRINSVGGSGSFGLDLSIAFYPKVEKVYSFTDIMSHTFLLNGIGLDRLYITNFEPAKHEPLLINLKTMVRHGMSHGHSQHCKKWEKLDPKMKLEIRMYDYELFEEKDGKTMLARLVEMVHGEGSKQALAVAGVKQFAGYCSCMRTTWPTKKKVEP